MTTATTLSSTNHNMTTAAASNNQPSPTAVTMDLRRTNCLDCADRWFVLQRSVLRRAPRASTGYYIVAILHHVAIVDNGHSGSFCSKSEILGRLWRWK